MSDLTHHPIAPELPLSQNPAIVYLSRLSSRSRRTMQGGLQSIVRLFDSQQSCVEFAWSELRYQHTAAIRAKLAEQYAPATANRILSALRGTLKEAWRLGLMSAEDYRRAIDVANISSTTLPAGRALNHSEIRDLLRICAEDLTAAGRRDAALMAVLRVGLRRSEVVKLTLGDVDPATGQLTIRGGKGRKDRTAYLPPGAIAYLQAWLATRGTEPGALFYQIDRWGHLGDRPMTDQAVLVILEKRGKQAGVAHFSPHDWRRTFVSDLLDSGVDLATVQKLAGHANSNTTIKYDRRGEDAKRRAANYLDI